MPTPTRLSTLHTSPPQVSGRAPHVVRRDVVVLMDPEVGGVLDALGHGQRLVVRARVLHEGQGQG